MAYFPMFIDIEKKKCLVAGGGTVALRKVRVLLDFGAQVMVVAPQIDSQILRKIIFRSMLWISRRTAVLFSRLI